MLCIHSAIKKQQQKPKSKIFPSGFANFLSRLPVITWWLITYSMTELFFYIYLCFLDREIEFELILFPEHPIQKREEGNLSDESRKRMREQL